MAKVWKSSKFWSRIHDLRTERLRTSASGKNLTGERKQARQSGKRETKTPFTPQHTNAQAPEVVKKWQIQADCH